MELRDIVGSACDAFGCEGGAGDVLVGPSVGADVFELGNGATVELTAFVAEVFTTMVRVSSWSELGVAVEETSVSDMEAEWEITRIPSPRLTRSRQDELALLKINARVEGKISGRKSCKTGELERGAKGEAQATWGAVQGPWVQTLAPSSADTGAGVQH